MDRRSRRSPQPRARLCLAGENNYNEAWGHRSTRNSDCRVGGITDTHNCIQRQEVCASGGAAESRKRV
eukprot:2562441-Pyramimonas_sp.AAC.1